MSQVGDHNQDPHLLASLGALLLRCLLTRNPPPDEGRDPLLGPSPALENSVYVVGDCTNPPCLPSPPPDRFSLFESTLSLREMLELLRLGLPAYMFDVRDNRLLCPGDCVTTGVSPLTRRGIELTGIPEPSLLLGRYSAASRLCVMVTADRLGLDATSIKVDD